MLVYFGWCELRKAHKVGHALTTIFALITSATQEPSAHDDERDLLQKVASTRD